MKLPTLPLLALLAGCAATTATTANYERILNSWLGASEVDLARDWGPPQSTYEVGGARFLTYLSNRSVFLPGSPGRQRTTLYGNTAYTTTTGAMPAQSLDMSCQTIFEVRDDRIASWRFRGNDCTAAD